jgi:dihydrofolate synthase/folylpolyglutamate synthase
MNYQKTLTYIMEQLPMYQRIGNPAYHAGLDNTIRLDKYFNYPHKHFKTIHVAGTNGKGSVSHMLASVLQEADYKVGLYTSPHLIDFRERIKVNGNIVTKKFVMEFINENRSFFDTFNPSFFEISVFMAFKYFMHSHVDIAVIEVGLGGRLDATNIISPVLSVITNIGKDHTEILGDTLEKIAGEKAGIIKRNTPFIVGESQSETLPVFSRMAVRQEAQMYIADEIYQIDYSLMSVDEYQVFNVKRNSEIHFANLKCGLLGHYQRRNTVTVLAAIEQLIRDGIPIAEKEIYSGIRNVISNTGLSGRWQLMQRNPTVVCDTAHNADGIRMVLQQAIETPCKNLHLVLGFVNDKDIREILKYMPSHASFYFTRLSVPRSMDELELVALAQRYGYRGKSFANVKDAFSAVKEKAAADDLVIITGSNFLVADFLTMSNEQ